MRNELSKLSLTICKDNYTNNCGRCPIRPACVDQVAIRCQEDLDKHIMRVNKLAKEVSV